MTKRRVFQWFTASLLFLCLAGIYSNVIVDDAPVRALAQKTAREKAGCNEKCKIDSFHGERSVVQERLEYDIEKHGHWTVICRRAVIVFGDYTCIATGGS